jgi:WD40 repeat protein
METAISVAFSLFSPVVTILSKKAGKQVLSMDPTAHELHDALIGDLSNIKELLDLLLKQDLAASVMHLHLAFADWKHGNFPKEDFLKAKDLAIRAFGVLKDMKNAPELILSAKIICFYYCISSLYDEEMTKERAFDLCMVIIKNLISHEHIRASLLDVTRKERIIFNKESKKSIYVGMGELIYSIGMILRQKNIHSRLLMNTTGTVTNVWACYVKEQMTLKEHGSSVNTLAVDEGHIISGSFDNTIRLWDKNMGECVRILTGHESGVRKLIADKGYIISGGGDSTIRIWDNNTGECIRILKGHEGDVYALGVDEGYIISGSRDNTIRIWDKNTGECIRTLQGHNDAVYTLVMDEGYIISGSWDRTITLWDKNTGECIRTLKGHEDAVYTLVVDGGYIISGSRDHTIRIWDKNTGECIRILKGHEDGVVTLVVDEGYIISGSRDSTIRIWDKNTGECIRILKGHDGSVYTLAADEGYIISGSHDNTIRIWGLSSFTGKGDSLKGIDYNIVYANDIHLDWKKVFAIENESS